MAAFLTDYHKYGRDEFEAIAPPPGYPCDSPAVGHLAHQPETGSDHNRTWLTLRELLDFPWHQKLVPSRGYVYAETYLDYWIGRVPPPPQDSYFTPPHGCRIVSNGVMERLIDEGGDVHLTVTLLNYGTPYAQVFDRFYRETLPLLRRQGEPEDVRIIASLSS
jgi:hypothetical protein